MRKPPTGEPCAGKPPARFGGRGGREPFPTPIHRSEPGYGRKLLALDQGGKQIQAYVYMAASTRAGLKPTREYLQTILDGATEAGLSQDYIATLRQQETVSSPDPACTVAAHNGKASGSP